MSLSGDVVTVLTRHGKPHSPQVASFVASGAEVWSDQHFIASYEALKKDRPDSRFKSMRSLYGSQRGKTMFICGSGPSLKEAPSKLPGFTLAINRAITHVQADVWCFGDLAAHRLFKDHQNAKTAEIATGAGMHLFFPDDPIYVIEAEGSPSRFKDESRRPLYWTLATFSWVLHWALKMTPQRIILVGCDFSVSNHFDGAEAHERTGEASLMSFRTAQIRMDEMFGPDKGEWFDPSIPIFDTAKDGYLPVQKTKLEYWL